jgi:N-acetylglucosaminyldiphosphoundecaprenol N-acetyl-beta-D-mannosaminyltransferase
MNSRSPFECFGVPIEGTSFEETLERIRAGSARWIVTANPEILLEAKRDPAYRDVLNRADLRIADGVGLALAARTKNIRLHRVTGVELSEGLMKEAAAQGWSVALIGGG